MEAVYEILKEISEAIGAEDLLIETCQQYLDQPAGYVANDEVPLLACMDSSYLLEVVTRAKKEFVLDEQDDEEDFDRVVLALEAKRVATAALCTIHHSTDADAVTMAARLLLMLCRLPGAESFGLCTTNVLTVIAQSIGRVALGAMKSTTNKRPITSVKNGKKGTKIRGPPIEGTRRSQRMVVEEDYEEEEDEEDEEEEMNLTQATTSNTQMTDPFQLSQR